MVLSTLSYRTAAACTVQSLEDWAVTQKLSSQWGRTPESPAYLGRLCQNRKQKMRERKCESCSESKSLIIEKEAKRTANKKIC